MDRKKGQTESEREQREKEKEKREFKMREENLEKCGVKSRRKTSVMIKSNEKYY